MQDAPPFVDLRIPPIDARGDALITVLIGVFPFRNESIIFVFLPSSQVFEEKTFTHLYLPSLSGGVRSFFPSFPPLAKKGRVFSLPGNLNAGWGSSARASRPFLTSTNQSGSFTFF